MVRGLAFAVLLVALAAGCGDGDKKSSGTEATTAGGTTTTAEPDTTSTPTTTTTPEQETFAYQTWFTRDDQLQLTWVAGERTIGVLTQAIQLLLAGPTSGDDDTAVPADTELINIDLANGSATIDLSSEFESASRLAVAQVVYTATQFPTVRAVNLRVEGQRFGTSSLKRRAFTTLLPPIVVVTPTGLAPVGSTFDVGGSANVFEANVTIRVLNEDGDEIFSDFTTATCGTGCRGRYKTTITVDFGDSTSGTLVVQDDDADGDGKPSYEVRIPLQFN